jgi:hypothetical protein
MQLANFLASLAQQSRALETAFGSYIVVSPELFILTSGNACLGNIIHNTANVTKVQVQWATVQA